MQLLEDYDGYIGSWVSDGSSMFNVLVTGDAEQAHADLREVWPGGLCVEQRDLATQKQIWAAQEAVNQADIEGLLSSGGGSSDGMLEVHVVLADAQTVEAINTAVEPWLTPGQVDIDGALTPVQPQS